MVSECVCGELLLIALVHMRRPILKGDSTMPWIWLLDCVGVGTGHALSMCVIISLRLFFFLKLKLKVFRFVLWVRGLV